MPKALEFKAHTYVPNRFYDFVRRINQGMAGDMQFRITPAAIVGTAPTALAWARNVLVEMVNAAGDVHDWFDATFAVGIGIADGSAAGTAGLIDTTGAVGTVLEFVDGQATIQVTGDAAAWLGGTRQVTTMTVTAGAGASGTLTMTVTAAALGGAVVVMVPVAIGDAAGDVAARIAAAYNADANFGAVCVATVVAAGVILTDLTPRANDGTWDSVVTAADGTGVTAAAVAATTAGVAPETVTLSVLTQTILGYVLPQVQQVEVFITPL